MIYLNFIITIIIVSQTKKNFGILLANCPSYVEFSVYWLLVSAGGPLAKIPLI